MPSRRSNRQTVLLLALTPLGWGETAFGVHLGNELAQVGYETHALTWDSTVAPFAGSKINVAALPEAAGAFLGLLLDDIVATVSPSFILLCDIVTSVRSLKRAGVSPESMLEYGIRVLGVDTWNSAVAGSAADLFGDERLDAEAMLEKIPLRLLPVPFLAPDAGAGTCRFVPECPSLPTRTRRYIRGELGILDADKLVLLCTSKWQHGPYDNPDGERLAVVVPQLISEYLARLGRNVHLVHVGQSRYDGLCLDSDRYHWMPSQPPNVFNKLIGSADLFLSLNVSAVSTIKAALSGVPTIALSNSYRANTKDELIALLGSSPHPIVDRYAASLLPIYPFTLWPLGFRAYLDATLNNNPFLSTVAAGELLVTEDALETLQALLFSGGAAAKLREAQYSYKKQLEKLPSPATMFELLTSSAS